MAFDFFVLPMPQAGSSKIVFASTRDGSMQIYSMNTDGSGQTRLTYSGANDDNPRWSPNGTKILFQSDRDHPDTGYMDIYLMNSDGSGVTRLTTDANDDRMASWSPDGSKLVFQSMRNGANYQVYAMNADGSNQANLTNTSASDGEPSWSPDGTKIAFASDRDRAGYDSICVMNSDGSNQHAITLNSGNVEDTQPIWSPDGGKIAFVSTRDSTTETWQETDDDGNIITKPTLHVNKEIYVMSADGSGQTRLTTDLANDDSPSWSPDGSKIVFRSDRERDCCDPSTQVWTMNDDGTGQVNISNSGNGDYSASWTSGNSSDSQLAGQTPPEGNQPPVANAGGSHVAPTGQSVQFSGAGSFDPAAASLVIHGTSGTEHQAMARVQPTNSTWTECIQFGCRSVIITGPGLRHRAS
jgi:Tol biopolymer transport system component